MSDTEHEPAESARPELDRRDTPDALHPESDDDEDRTDRKLPPGDDGVAPRESPSEKDPSAEEPPTQQT